MQRTKEHKLHGTPRGTKQNDVERRFDRDNDEHITQRFDYSQWLKHEQRGAICDLGQISDKYFTAEKVLQTIILDYEYKLSNDLSVIPKAVLPMPSHTHPRDAAIKSIFVQL